MPVRDRRACRQWVGLRVTKEEKEIALRLGEGCLTDGIRAALWRCSGDQRRMPLAERLRAIANRVERLERS